MAYLVFKNEEGLTRSAGTLIRAAKTDADVQIIHGGNASTVKLVEIVTGKPSSFLKTK